MIDPTIGKTSSKSLMRCNSFLIKIFEESLEETIFSRGKDRDRASEMLPPKIGDGHLNKFSGRGSSVVPCSLLGHTNKERFASPVEHVRIGKASDSKSSDCNVGSLCNLEHLVRYHKKTTDRLNFGQNETARTHIREHMFSLVKSPAVALMEEKIGDAKRSKKGGKISRTPDFQPVTLANGIELDAMDESQPGPIYHEAPIDLDHDRSQDILPKGKACKPMIKIYAIKRRPCGLGPKPFGANRTKPKAIKGKALMKGPNTKHPPALNTRGSNVEDQTSADVGELPGESIHDNKIENMNRIFLVQSNLVTTEEM
ncbi:hypothetical protein Ancab_038576 [Ancistrocladus abbreviatus]